MTTLIRAATRAAVVTGMLGAALALPQAAVAGDAPGNNGTLKVHAPGTPFEVRANEPRQACAFYLAGFNFDSNQVINYAFTVQGGPNNGDPAGTPGSFTVGPDNGRPTGDGRTPLLERGDHDLPDGRYKVTGTTDDGSKSKVFSINCPGGTNPEPLPTPTPEPDPDEPGGVGGVGTPADEDDGPPGVGGVATGGGGLTGATAVDVTIPLLMTAATGLALAAGSVRRRRAE